MKIKIELAILTLFFSLLNKYFREDGKTRKTTGIINTNALRLCVDKIRIEAKHKYNIIPNLFLEYRIGVSMVIRIAASVLGPKRRKLLVFSSYASKLFINNINVAIIPT